MSKESNPLQLNPNGLGAINPYAPTMFSADMAAAPEDVEQYRKAHLSHEASVKSIGVLYLLGAIFLVPFGAFTIIAALRDPNQANNVTEVNAVVGIFYLGLGLFQGFVGYGLRKLRGWTRIAASVYSGIGLLGFPVGTLISGYFLYLLLSEKGRIVFSESYKKVIEQTPHIRYKTSIIVWIALGLLVTLILVGIIAFLTARNV